MTSQDYQSFLEGPCKKQWERIGIRKRAGVATPLFSLYSSSSTGIGELPDLYLLVDWCVKTNISIIQLLPLNDVGFQFTPYDSESTFALDPMYLSLSRIKGVEVSQYVSEIEAMRKTFPAGREHVDYGIKAAKLELLWKMFQARSQKLEPVFKAYCEQASFWLPAFALFKVIKQTQDLKAWQEWPEPLRDSHPEALNAFLKENQEAILFQKWLQWQLFEQMCDVKKYAQKKKVFLMGDLPFLVSKDSSDVWGNQQYFKMDVVTGAPPDAFFANGQRWGMPPYDWLKIEADGYSYLKEKLQYAEHFYDFYRIDHAVGLFRVWTIQISESLESAGLNGAFDPSDESLWEEHGKKIISSMIEGTSMLPCAEDLGVVPDCSYKVLHEFNIPGMDVQRWKRDWAATLDFLPAEEYRKNSIAVLSTHDMTSFMGWWDYEIGTVEEVAFRRQCEIQNRDYENLRPQLFDLSTDGKGRLRWHQDMDVARLIEILQMNEQEATFFVKLLKETHGEKRRFLKYIGVIEANPSYATLIQKSLEKANQSQSIFSIQLLQDWLTCDESFKVDPWNFRINFPGSMGPQNWSVVMPFSLEKMISHPINSTIKKINS